MRLVYAQLAPFYVSRFGPAFEMATPNYTIPRGGQSGKARLASGAARAQAFLQKHAAARYNGG
ncbi:hypothetical protein YQ44_22570 [Janthinobacterium sp. 1_2014MBL_MicDiv]|nr:hypothetical protein YQ44_22570 [Janthinobacterium sp. 1_2014MBL_MicDiv]